MTRSRLLRGLPLKLPTGGIVTPLHFDYETQASLRKWLDFSHIGRLQNCAEISRNLIQSDEDTPTLGDQREVLETAVELATALATILEQAPSTAEAELNLVFHKFVGGLEQQNLMVIKLKMLALGIDASLQKLPKQDRRKSPVHFVSMIANVLHDAGIKPSASESSRFFKICQALFSQVIPNQDGNDSSPTGAIRAFMRQG